MRVALHDEPVGEAEMIEERDEALDRRIGWRIAAARLNLSDGPKICAWVSQAPAGGATRGRLGCGTGPAMRGGSLARFIVLTLDHSPPAHAHAARGGEGSVVGGLYLLDTPHLGSYRRHDIRRPSPPLSRGEGKRSTTPV
jgi:hypothetical protein